jgi:hypothetical protein
VTPSLGSSAKIKLDRPKDRLTPRQVDADVYRILELVVEVRRAWEEAVDAGSYAPRTETNGRGKGFTDSDPTHSAVDRPTQKQLRGAARRAASLIGDSRERLEDAAAILHRGMLRTDPEVLEEYLEKHRAAIQGQDGK